MSGFLVPPMGSSAEFSPCLQYRYFLRRVWDDTKPLCAWVMLNPSTADAQADDPTIRKCMGFAHRWRCGGICVANLFAWRATDPDELAGVADPVGPRNETWIREAAKCPMVVLGWGAHPMAPRQARKTIDILRLAGAEPLFLRATKGCQPSHPLYLPYHLQPLAITPEIGGAA